MVQVLRNGSPLSPHQITLDADSGKVSGRIPGPGQYVLRANYSPGAENQHPILGTLPQINARFRTPIAVEYSAFDDLINGGTLTAAFGGEGFASGRRFGALPANATVTFTAVPAAGHKVARWESNNQIVCADETGGEFGETQTCELALDKSLEVVAYFHIPQMVDTGVLDRECPSASSGDPPRQYKPLSDVLLGQHGKKIGALCIIFQENDSIRTCIAFDSHIGKIPVTETDLESFGNKLTSNESQQALEDYYATSRDFAHCDDVSRPCSGGDPKPFTEDCDP